jgi:hypothetical protein
VASLVTQPLPAPLALPQLLPEPVPLLPLDRPLPPAKPELIEELL